MSLLNWCSFLIKFVFSLMVFLWHTSVNILGNLKEQYINDKLIWIKKTGCRHVKSTLPKSIIDFTQCIDRLHYRVFSIHSHPKHTFVCDRIHSAKHSVFITHEVKQKQKDGLYDELDEKHTKS